ncbi:tetratricopeptide repeat protein [Candidatus Bipolaricaulota bacterium]|nr:tetratricopeptide repeat protein [Candidatus Bipolaricaulota bacterium]
MNLSKEDLLETADKFAPTFRQVRLTFLLFFTLTMPLVIYLGNTEYGYTKTIYTFVYISLLTILWLIELFLNDEEEISLTRLSIPVGLLVISGLLSLINAPSKGVVLQSLGLLVYFYLVYLLIANTIKTETEARYLLIALMTSGLGATVYGLLQYLGIVRGAHGFAARAGSIISVMGNQNYLGGFISYLFIPGFALILISKSKILKTYLILVLGLFFFLLFPIGARGAWLSLVFASLVFAAGLLYYKPIDNLRKLWLTLLVIVLVLFLAYLFASAPGPLNSVLSYSAPEDGDRSWGVFTPVIRPLVEELVKKGGARVEDWYIGLEMLKDHPLVGIGLGNYKIKFLEYRGRFLTTEKGRNFGGFIPRGAQAHNEYLQFTAEMGIIGLIAMLVAIIMLLANIFARVGPSGPPDQWSTRILGLALAGGVIGYLIHSGVSFPAHLPASSLAAVAFLGLINSEAFGDVEYTLNFSGLTRYLTLIVIFAFLITVTVFAYRDWRANVVMGKGKDQLQYGNYHVAKERLRESLALDFHPRQTYYFLGVAERQLGNEMQALEYFEKSLGRFEPYNLYLQLGTLYQSQNQMDKAKGALRKFLKLGAEESLNLKAKFYLATIAIRENKVDEAESILQEILNEDPKFERAIILQGDIADFRGNASKAREKWEEALQMINDKLSRVDSRLSGEVQLEELGDLRSEKERLTRIREQVSKKLGES